MHPTCSLEPRPDVTNTHCGLWVVSSGRSATHVLLVTWSPAMVALSSRPTGAGGLVWTSVDLTFEPCELGDRGSPLGLVVMVLCGTGGVRGIIEVGPCLKLGQCQNRATLFKYHSTLKRGGHYLTPWREFIHHCPISLHCLLCIPKYMQDGQKFFTLRQNDIRMLRR